MHRRAIWVEFMEGGSPDMYVVRRGEIEMFGNIFGSIVNRDNFYHFRLVKLIVRPHETRIYYYNENRPAEYGIPECIHHAALYAYSILPISSRGDEEISK